jgi:hypothetical protein
MPDYKQSALTGTAWQRCKTVVINNPLEGAKGVFFQEERVISLDGQNLKQPVDGCGKNFAADGSFPLLDPNTNVPLGVTMSHTELYVALYSLYMQTAAERDGVRWVW